MKLEVILDKENGVFLTKSITVSKATVDESGNLILEGEDGKVTMSVLDLFAMLGGMMPKIMELVSNLSSLGGANDEPGDS